MLIVTKARIKVGSTQTFVVIEQSMYRGLNDANPTIISTYEFNETYERAIIIVHAING